MPSKPSPAEVTAEIARVLGLYRFHYGSEVDLQLGIEKALEDAGVPFTRELTFKKVLGRIDFMVHALYEVGIEVKIGGANTDVGRQLARYLKTDELDGIVLVTSKRRHRTFPTEFNGKPVSVVWLGHGAS
jgi:hypothetical protein